MGLLDMLGAHLFQSTYGFKAKNEECRIPYDLKAQNEDEAMDHWKRFYRRKSRSEHEEVIQQERMFSQMDDEQYQYEVDRDAYFMQSAQKRRENEREWSRYT